MRVFEQRGDLGEQGGDVRWPLDFDILRHAPTMLDAPHKSITIFPEFIIFDWTWGALEALLFVPAQGWPGQCATRAGGLGSVGPDAPDPQWRSDMIKDTVSKKSPAKSGVDVKKSAAVEQILTREEGASLDELTAATGWQPHSCRAFLTGLRNKGWAIERKKREDGTTIWTGNARATVGQA